MLQNAILQNFSFLSNYSFIRGSGLCDFFFITTPLKVLCFCGSEASHITRAYRVYLCSQFHKKTDTIFCNINQLL